MSFTKFNPSWFNDMKIGFICIKNAKTSGGVEKYTLEMARRLCNKGHQIYIYTTDNNDIPIIKGVRFVYVPSIRKGPLEKITGSMFATFYALYHGVEIFHYQAFGAGAFAFIPRIFGKVSITQGHGIEWKRAKWGRLGKLVLILTEAMSVKFSNSVLTVSRVQAKDIEERYGKVPAVIPGGISPIDCSNSDVLRDLNIKRSGYILFVARLVAEKGAHYLIDAFKNIYDPNLRLVVAGGYDDNDPYFRQLIVKAQNDERIIFAGFKSQDDLSVLYTNALTYVIPSELEGLSLSLLDALAYGVPCVASDIPENLEALDGGRLGTVFANADIFELTEILNYVVTNQAAVIETASEAKQFVRLKYNWDYLAEILHEFYIGQRRSNLDNES